MKRIIVGISVVSIIAFGAVAFAQGMGGWGGGHMMGRGHMGGYGGGHMGAGGYGHMGGMTGPGYGATNQTDQKFLDETADLRKELHNKRFEYEEAARDPDTTVGALRQIEKEIYELENRIYEKNPRTDRGYRAYR